MTISADDDPMGDCKEQKGFFPWRFTHSRRGIRSSTSLHTHTHRMWGSIGGHGTTAVQGRMGGQPHYDHTRTSDSV